MNQCLLALSQLARDRRGVLGEPPDDLTELRGHPLEASNVAEYWEVFSSFHRAMPDLHQEVVELVVTDSVVAERWTNCGTHLGEFNGLPPSGRTVEFTGTTFFHVADGLIVEEFNTVDLYGLLQQIEPA